MYVPTYGILYLYYVWYLPIQKYRGTGGTVVDIGSICTVGITYYASIKRGNLRFYFHVFPFFYRYTNEYSRRRRRYEKYLRMMKKYIYTCIRIRKVAL